MCSSLGTTACVLFGRADTYEIRANQYIPRWPAYAARSRPYRVFTVVAIIIVIIIMIIFIIVMIVVDVRYSWFNNDNWLTNDIIVMGTLSLETSDELTQTDLKYHQIGDINTVLVFYQLSLSFQNRYFSGNIGWSFFFNFYIILVWLLSYCFSILQIYILRGKIFY